MAAAAGEHRLQMRILFALSLLGALIALAFSQSAGLFNPPSIIAAGAQLPTDPAGGTAEPGGIGGQNPGARGPGATARNFLPRTPGAPGGASRQGAVDDGGLGGPIETADATGAIPPSIADDFATPPSSAATTPGGNRGGPNNPDIGGPGIGGPGPSGPGAIDPGVDPGTPVGPVEPNVPTPTTPVPEPATWLILTIGIAIVGGALRRRRSAAPVELRPALG